MATRGVFLATRSIYGVYRGMTDRRLPWGSRENPVSLGWAIERVRKDRLSQLAQHTGVSNAVFLEAVIDHLKEELKERGLPSRWPEHEPTIGELPISDGVPSSDGRDGGGSRSSRGRC